MSYLTLAGAPVAAQVLSQVKTSIEVESLSIKIAAIFVGDNPASETYIRKKQEAAESVGMQFELLKKEPSISQVELLQLIDDLNQDASIHGYIIQLPLPAHIDQEEILTRIDPKKDIDGFHPLNIGQLSLHLPKSEYLPPATAEAVMRLLDYYEIPLQGKRVVMVGKSNIVGKPLALMLMNRDATVTICHKETNDLTYFTQNADIIISATGVPHLIKGTMVNKDVTTIDVGFSKVDGKLYGDIDIDSMTEKVKAHAPVPGGIGPITVSILIQNALKAYYLQHAS